MEDERICWLINMPGQKKKTRDKEIIITIITLVKVGRSDFLILGKNILFNKRKLLLGTQEIWRDKYIMFHTTSASATEPAAGGII